MSKNKHINDQKTSGNVLTRQILMKRYAFVLAIVWSVIVITSYVWNMTVEKQNTLEDARIQARTAIEKDILYRNWNASHGGVYVPVTEKTFPNPYLPDTIDRDIRTPSGKLLTLMTPEYMTRQVHEMAKLKSETLGHITSLRPIRPENAADSWETIALRSLEQGEKEISSLQSIEGNEYMRMIIPLITEKSCLKCHAFQGYKEGDTRGGISVSVHMKPLWTISQSHIITLSFAHFLLWFVGLCGIVAGNIYMNRSDLKRIQAENSLRISEDRYIDISNAPDLYVSFDVKGRILQCNQTVAKELGYTIEEIIGRDIFDMYHQDSIRKVKETFSRLYDTGEVRDQELQMKRKDGNPLDVSLNASAVRDEEGRILYSRSSCRNITDKKLLERQLIHAQKMESVGTLAGGVAHDFNNSLTAIIGFANILNRRMQKDDPLKLYVNQIQTASENATALIADLLTFSRKHKVNLISLDINDIVKKLEHILLRIIGEDIELSTELTNDHLNVMVDFSQMEHVLMNLFANARDAMPDGGVLTIRTESYKLDNEFIRSHGFGKPGIYAAIYISDTGTGIDKNIIGRIFEPFFTTKDVDKGTGLGLSIVYGIIKQHNGYIDVYSQTGIGTTFKIYLPLIKQEEETT